MRIWYNFYRIHPIRREIPRLGPWVVWLNSGGNVLTFWKNWAALSIADFILVLAMGVMVFNLLITKDVAQRAQVQWLART